MFSAKSLDTFGDAKIVYFQGVNNFMDLNKQYIEERLLKVNPFDSFMKQLFALFDFNISDSRTGLCSELEELCNENLLHINNLISNKIFGNLVHSRKAIYLMKEQGVQFHSRDQLEYANVKKINYGIDEKTRMISFDFELDLYKEGIKRLTYMFIIEKRCLFGLYNGFGDVREV